MGASASGSNCFWCIDQLAQEKLDLLTVTNSNDLLSNL